MTVRRDRKTDARGIRLGAALLAVCLLAVACLSGTGCSVIFITAEEQSRNAASSAAEGTTARQDDEPTGRRLPRIWTQAITRIPPMCWTRWRRSRRRGIGRT